MMSGNVYIKEITNEYLLEKSQIIAQYFDKYKNQNDIWGYFAEFYQKHFSNEYKIDYIKQIFQDARKYFAIVGKSVYEIRIRLLFD